jgi:hypothetical protein
LNVLSKDDNGVIQFSSDHFPSEQVEEGLKQLRAKGFIATIDNFVPRRRANPLFDKCVRIKRVRTAMTLKVEAAEKAKTSAEKVEPTQSQDSLMALKLKELAAAYSKR